MVIFVKSVQRCMALSQLLTEQNFPAVAIHRGMTQEERLKKYQEFKDFQKVTYDARFYQFYVIFFIIEVHNLFIFNILQCVGLCSFISVFFYEQAKRKIH